MIDPRTVENYRNAAGLPNANTANWLALGNLVDPEGIVLKNPDPLDGHDGGLNEFVVPNPEEQIELMRIESFDPE